MSPDRVFPMRRPSELIARAQQPLDDDVMNTARRIVARVRDGGTAALEEFTARYGDRPEGFPLTLDSKRLVQALEEVGPEAETASGESQSASTCSPQRSAALCPT